MRRRGYAPIISIRSPVVENKVGTNGMATARARAGENDEKVILLPNFWPTIPLQGAEFPNEPKAVPC
jgi:hypothetical protein